MKAPEDKQDPATDQIRSLIRAELKEATTAWPRKNGGTWTEFVGKLVTPERIMLLFLLVYQVGGQVTQFKSDLSAVQGREKEIIEQHKKLNDQLGSIATTLSDHDRLLISIRSEATKSDERMKTLPTRREFVELRKLVATLAVEVRKNP